MVGIGLQQRGDASGVFVAQGAESCLKIAGVEIHGVGITADADGVDRIAAYKRCETTKKAVKKT
jgi:hypothetical protein